MVLPGMRSQSTRSLAAPDADGEGEGQSAKDFLLNAASTRLHAAFDGRSSPFNLNHPRACLTCTWSHVRSTYTFQGVNMLQIRHSLCVDCSCIHVLQGDGSDKKQRQKSRKDSEKDKKKKKGNLL